MLLPIITVGLQRERLGDYEGAIADFERAIEINPQYANAYSNRGFAKSRLGDYEGAMADYERAIEINPQMHRARFNLGRAYIRRAIDFLNPF